MADNEREDRSRRRAAVQREMTRLRSTDETEVTETDESDGTEETGEHDLVDAVDEELRRARDVQNDDPAA
jgi:hypothetical protein